MNANSGRDCKDSFNWKLDGSFNKARIEADVWEIAKNTECQPGGKLRV